MQPSLRKAVKYWIEKWRLYSLLKPWYSGQGSILLFHRVCAPPEQSQLKGNRCLEISPQYLERIIDYLGRKRYCILSLDDVHRVLMGQLKIAGKFVAFTFDDGYRDNFTQAYPILKKHGIPFAIYVTTSFLDRTAVLWWYLIEDLLRTHDTLEFDLNHSRHRYSCGSLAEKEAVFFQLRQLILKNLNQAPIGVMQSLWNAYGVDPCRKTAELAMDWQTAIDLARDPLVTIAAHTLNHLRLGELDAETVKHEVLSSKQVLEARIGRAVEHFAYPFGESDDVGAREFEIVRTCGFKTATTTRMGHIFAAHRHHLEALPRLMVDGLEEHEAQLDRLFTGYLACVRNKTRRIVID
jgi:peptidoglycan/xylan/chitin deacetylase (PgdA/CDA1 family)